MNPVYLAQFALGQDFCVVLLEIISPSVYKPGFCGFIKRDFLLPHLFFKPLGSTANTEMLFIGSSAR